MERLHRNPEVERASPLASGQNETSGTPIEYLGRLRIQKAMEMLRNTDLSITEIALEVGFNDNTYFTRQFRPILGESPRMFRPGKV